MRFGDALRVSMRGSLCIYCGEIAETAEHFPPASVTMKGYLFSACKECNNFASDESPFNIEDRMAYVKSKITKRYRHLQRAHEYNEDEYNEDELEDFEGNLKKVCLLWSEAKNSIAKRLAWSVQDYFDHIEQGNPFVVTNVVSDGITWIEKELSKNTNLNKNCLYCGKPLFFKKVKGIFCKSVCGNRYRKQVNIKEASNLI